MTSENYYHKLIVGKDAYIAIKITEHESGNPILSLEGCLLGLNWCSYGYTWIETLKEVFDKNPEDLNIPKEDFDQLMDIARRCYRKEHPVLDDIVDIADFLKSLKSTPENQEIEEELQKKLRSEDPFSIKINGHTIFLEENQPPPKYSDFCIQYRIDADPVAEYFTECNNMNIKGNGSSLTREEILTAFEGHIQDAIQGDGRPFDKDDFYNDYDYYEDCINVWLQLGAIKDLYELNEILVNARETNYTFWEFEGNQAYPQEYPQEYLPKKEHFSSDFR